MLKAEKTWVWQTLQAWCWVDCLVADAAVWQACRNPIATIHQESRCLFRFENEPSVKQLLPCWKNEHLPSFNVLPVLPVERRFVQQSSYRSPVLKKWHTWRCQPVTLVREPFSSVFPFLQKVGSMKRVSFAILKVDKAWVWQTPQTLCWEEPSFLIHRGLPRILSLPGITLTLPVPSKNEQRIEQILTCWKNKKSCQSCPLNGHSCSNPVHSNHQSRTESTHAGRQAVTTVREPFSPQFPFSQRVRSMKSVSFAMLKTKKELRKLEFGRHLKPCAGKILWLLMLLFDGFQESCCYQESRGLFRLRAKISRALSNFHHAGRTDREKTCRCQASDHCEWTTLSTVSIFAKGQINDECLLRNVESWESLSLAVTSDLVLGRALVADAAVWQASRNPIDTSYQESPCLFRFENEPSVKQLLPCWKNEHLLSFNVLAVLPIEWAFVQQSSPQ